MARHVQPCAVPFAALCHFTHSRPQEPVQAPCGSDSGCPWSTPVSHPRVPAGLKGHRIWRATFPRASSGWQHRPSSSSVRVPPGAPALASPVPRPAAVEHAGGSREEFARTPPLLQTSVLRFSDPPICALPLLPLGSPLLNGPGLGIRPSPPARRPPGPGILPRLPRVQPPPPGFLSPRSGAPCQAHDVMVYVNQ